MVATLGTYCVPGDTFPFEGSVPFSNFLQPLEMLLAIPFVVLIAQPAFIEHLLCANHGLWDV